MIKVAFLKRYNFQWNKRGNILVEVSLIKIPTAAINIQAFKLL